MLNTLVNANAPSQDEIDMALANAAKNCSFEDFKVLFETHCDPSLRTLTSHRMGFYLCEAARVGADHIFNYILTHAKAAVGNEDANAAFRLTADRGQIDSVTQLLKACGEKISDVTISSKLLAIKVKHSELYDVLLKDSRIYNLVHSKDEIPAYIKPQADFDVQNALEIPKGVFAKFAQKSNGSDNEVESGSDSDWDDAPTPHRPARSTL